MSVEELLGDADLPRRDRREGRLRYWRGAARWQEHLYGGIERHIREALGSR
jgi:hypothetical protein